MKYQVLKEYFGHTAFRAGQESVVDALLHLSDVLCVMPTGAGKSVCYQVPALLFDGITLVVSPLISLMKDQVSALRQSGVAAAYLNSSLTPTQYSRALYNMRQGMYKLIYVAPERLLTPDFLDACADVKISLLAVDEAHCISQWGQDFRPSYLRIPEFVDALGYRPVIGAFTATATEKVKGDIEASLRLRNPYKITTGFDRENLRFSVLRPASKIETLLRILTEKKRESGIVYCATRKAVEEVCDRLCRSGFSATMYHAGLPDAVRRENQDDFVYDRRSIMVATNAFGMGIDKSNVSFVIHYNMPKNLENYYQEAGRAGRDGAAAECILLYNPIDVQTNKFLIERSEGNPELSPEEQENIRQKDYENLRQMTFYSTTNTCLRQFILGYFGEKSAAYCGNCSNCLTQFETLDITEDAQKILSCVRHTGERFGKKMICDILRGSKNQRILQLGLDTQLSYGILAAMPESRVREIMDFLEFEGYLTVAGGEYPILQTTETADSVLFGKKPLTMQAAKPKAPSEKKRKHIPSAPDADVDESLLEKLKDLRRTLATDKAVPAYIIFSDAALIEMCQKLPRTPEEFLAVSGVGKVKLSLYGEDFMEIIRTHQKTKA